MSPRYGCPWRSNPDQSVIPRRLRTYSLPARSSTRKCLPSGAASKLVPSEADRVSDEQQVFGKIAPAGGASIDICQAPLEILMDTNRHVDTPGTAPHTHH